MSLTLATWLAWLSWPLWLRRQISIFLHVYPGIVSAIAARNLPQRRFSSSLVELSFLSFRSTSWFCFLALWTRKR